MGFCAVRSKIYAEGQRGKFLVAFGFSYVILLISLVRLILALLFALGSKFTCL
jgi:hypothetical protein